jgi:hypothetical protein
VGFSKGFEKVSGVIGAGIRGTGKVLGAGIKGAGKMMGAGTGALGALSVGSELYNAKQNFNKNMQSYRNEMQR